MIAIEEDLYAKFGTLPSEQARSIVSVGLLACQWEVVQDPLRLMTADRI